MSFVLPHNSTHAPSMHCVNGVTAVAGRVLVPNSVRCAQTQAHTQALICCSSALHMLLREDHTDMHASIMEA
jgi:hypothetical protein